MRDLLVPSVLLIIALGFTYAGFQIAVRKKFNLMDSYPKYRRKYVDFRGFAIRHGLIELIGGALMLLCAVMCLYYKLLRESFVVAFCGTGIILILLKLNKIFSRKNW